MKLSQPPDPQDVRYDDLASDRMAQQGSSISAFLLTACVFVFWVPLTAFISGFTSLEELKQFRGLSFLNDLPISMERLLEGVFAQLGLKLVLALLPTVLMIIINCNFLKSGNEAQLRMQNRYFVFLVTFVVLVSAMSMTLLHTLKMIAADPKEISVLFKKLPDSSHFYINYLIVGWFTLAMALLRISPLVKYMLFKTASSSPAEARASSEPEDQNGDGMGARMANVTLMMTIFLVFCACSPSIALAAFVWFVFGSHVYRWLVLYAETKKPDLGGAFWDAAIKHLFGSLCLYIGLMFVLLINAPWGAGKPAGAVLICGCGLLLKYLKHRSIIWKSMPYEAVVDSDEADRRDGKRRPSLMQSAPETERYAQEECLVPKHEESQVLAMQAQADTSALQVGGKPGKRSDGS